MERMKRDRRKAQRFWKPLSNLIFQKWLDIPEFFGKRLPVSLAIFLFFALFFHIIFEVYKIIPKCEMPPPFAKCDLSLESISKILEKTILKIGSDTARNLSLLLGASIGWFFIYRRITIADQNARSAEQSVIVERFTRAIDQIASEDSPTRLGGILSLEQITLTQKEERKKIVHILVLFIRKHVKRQTPSLSEETTVAYRAMRLDIEAAVHALSRVASMLTYQKQYNKKKRHLCYLNGVDLRGFQLQGVDFSHFDLIDANFSRSWLFKANLTFAQMFGANFSHASLRDANLTSANMRQGKFVSTSLKNANLSSAYIREADLTSASLKGSNLTLAFLEQSNLTLASLRGSKLITATLKHVDFTSASLRNADLASATLEYVNFTSASLRNADLASATLKHVNLSNTNLLYVRNLSQKQLDQAYYIRGHPPQNLPKELNLPQERDKPVEKDEEQPTY